MSVVTVDPEAGASERFTLRLRETDGRGGETRMVHCRHFISTAWERPERTYMLHTRTVDANTRASVASSNVTPDSTATVVDTSGALLVFKVGILDILDCWEVKLLRRCRLCSQFASP